MLEASRRPAQRLRAVLLRDQSREETHEGFEDDDVCAIGVVRTLAQGARAPRAKCNAAQKSTRCSSSGASTSG